MELLAVFLPLLAFVISFLFGKQLGDKGAQFITCSALIVAAFASISLFFDVAIGENSYTTELSSWIISGDLNVSWALRIDSLSVVMMCVINIVSACVHVYSVGYMSHDPCKGRFMAYLSLFTFAMLMLVTADNLLQLFFGWEGVGLASYLLIGFWNHKNSANAAAVKAFVVNRVGDFGLALAMMAIFVVFGTLQFDDIFEAVPEMAGTYFSFIGQEYHALTLIGLLLFVGAIGKSAQLGLHTWLPDAMEGPTPVSALIHAATMVTAGVFLVARMSPLYEYAPEALMVVTLVGGATAFVAATIGLTQFDIKRVIAYSTMSQLGYMFFALGVSAYGAAMFHLMTHAFFKALLFLGAGSVIHAMSDEQDMRKMGGIWKKIPMTYGLMWVGSLALAGIPPFAGFYSKDIVLEAAWADHTWFGNIAFWLGIAAAFMTAFYTWRLLIMTFHGKPRASEKVMSHIHESPAVMLGPLVVLATGALFSGMVFYEPFVGSGKAEHVAEIELDAHHTLDVEIEHDIEAPVLEEEGVDSGMGREKFWGQAIRVQHQNDTLESAHHVPEWVKFLPLVMGLLGIGLAYLAYMLLPGIPEKIKTIFAVPYALFFNKWFFDELYNAIFIKTSFMLGRLFWRVGDQNTIDRLGPDGSAKSVQKLAGVISRFQSGYVFQYAFVMMVALIAIVSWFVFKSGQGF
ncbi:MAG TPA: NADH-quinone oxidoreductase subunit L [Alphaproteobacteria bacterium]|nr:NADH-quinone oxidoreductase subunit L [Alphaproteobacteria bacterium]USO06119.1 MAG: NADH-quinone oxidoreductase subunit L [Rhodospirillales bacterium]HOO82551.1 NADH-quinone oxidoreductase subunit L [Alphaproteobacteria bacterium]